MKRFYGLSYKGEIPAGFEDIGNILRISGILFQGQGLNALALLPVVDSKDLEYQVIVPSLAEWGQILKQSDNPVFFEKDETGVVKAMHRKTQYAVSNKVRQTIWRRDGFTCLYCGREMGKDATLTIDHFQPLERGGSNDEHNLASACQNCNKDKGAMDPRAFCDWRGCDFDGLQLYLTGRAPRSFIGHLAQ